MQSSTVRPLVIVEERENSMLKKAEHEIVCVAEFTAKEGKEEELLEAMRALIPPTRSEKGNIRLNVPPPTGSAFEPVKCASGFLWLSTC